MLKRAKAITQKMISAAYTIAITTVVFLLFAAILGGFIMAVEIARFTH
jgi:hypothetical protein